MLDSLKIILKETLEIYELATLGGSLFIPFFLCLVYLLFSPTKEDDRARTYLVYPSLVLMLFLFNPVLIHFLYKYIEIPERIARIYWPLPMDMIFVYCLIRLFSTLRQGWKKALLRAVVLSIAFIGNIFYGRKCDYETVFGVIDVCVSACGAGRMQNAGGGRRKRTGRNCEKYIPGLYAR